MMTEPKPTVDLVAFDVGGTTVRDEGIVPLAIRQALAPLGVEPSDEDILSVRGAAKRQAIASLIPGIHPVAGAADVVVNEAYARFLTVLHTAYAEGPLEEADGASDLFAWLHARGVKIALTTGFDVSTCDLMLRRLGWNDGRLDAVVSAEEVTQGRPAPYMLFRAMERTGVRNVTRIAAVGDTAFDLEAGANAGARLVVGVLGGAHDRETLERAPHTHVLTRLTELRDILGEGR